MVGALRPASSFAIVNANVITMAPLATRRRLDQPIEEADLGCIRDAAIVANGIIRAIGPYAECARAIDDARRSAGDRYEEIDARGRIVMPGLVDAHTHALYAGDRLEDFEAIATGRKPRQGIRHTVEETRRRSLDELVDIGARHLDLMATHGTTTAEIKSGYALTAEGEVTMLRAIAALDRRPQNPHTVATFCGAHALPPEFADYDAFVDELCDRILPLVARERIAKFADAFCETGYFTPLQSERFLVACANTGMRLRLHADELSPSGGAGLAARLRCASADHLNYVDPEGISALARSGTVAVLCPATTEYLGLDRFAPARDLIAAGVPVALATDFNPGTSPSPSLQLVAHLARRRLKMTACETIAGVTIQAARSLGTASGSLAVGLPADVILIETGDYREFGYYFGANLVSRTFVGSAPAENFAPNAALPV